MLKISGVTMRKYFYFGEIVDGYDVRVLNEREARAGAGILFLFAFISFMNSYLLRDFLFTQIFVSVFMIDFIIRIFINPKFSPSLLLGRMMVQNQIPEYVGAPQKRAAWSLGLTLAVIMFFVIVVFELKTPIKIAICVLCLGLLFFESAFGICLGCKLYNYLSKNSAKYCAGGVCQIRAKDEVQKFSAVQIAIIIGSVLVISATTLVLIIKRTPPIELKTTPIQPKMKCGSGM